jgi:hypothetical protein
MATSQPNPQSTEQSPVAKTSLLDQIVEETERERAKIGARYMPTLTVKQFTEREKLLKELREMLIGPTKEHPEGVDYGVIPGTEKPTLLLPGAQKVCAYFGYVPRYRFDVSIEDWTGSSHGEPLFYYRLVCDLEKDSKTVGSGLGSCNSWESKYRYRWSAIPPAGVAESTLVSRDASLYEPLFAIQKGETAGKYGKPAEYWQRWKDAIESGVAVADNSRKTKTGTYMQGFRMGGTEYRVPNENFPDVINTVLKIGKKRAYIDATLSATGLSQYFTQDVEDLVERTAAPEDIDTGGHPVGTKEAANHVAETKLKQADTEIPAEVRPYIDALRAKGGVNNCFKFLQDELIKAGGIEADRGIYEPQTKALRARYPEPQIPPFGEIKGLAMILWYEVERLRKVKAEAEEQNEAGAFATGPTR